MESFAGRARSPPHDTPVTPARRSSSTLQIPMERVAVAGLSLHQTDVEGLERVKRALAALEEPPAKALADCLGASEAVLISTCNRCELVFARESGHAPAREDRAALAAALGLDARDELAARLFLHTGRSAARHLLRVAASLDSLVLGEDQ